MLFSVCVLSFLRRGFLRPFLLIARLLLGSYQITAGGLLSSSARIICGLSSSALQCCVMLLSALFGFLLLSIVRGVSVLSFLQVFRLPFGMLSIIRPLLFGCLSSFCSLCIRGRPFLCSAMLRAVLLSLEFLRLFSPLSCCCCKFLLLLALGLSSLILSAVRMFPQVRGVAVLLLLTALASARPCSYLSACKVSLLSVFCCSFGLNSPYIVAVAR